MNINEKIEKYKKSIDNIFKSKKYEAIEEFKEKIETLLDMDLKNHKINEEEYDILNDFLEQLLQMDIQKQVTNNNSKEFKEELRKKLPIIDAITTYKGEFRGIAPERKEINKKQEPIGDER